jgi:hypothetical protein
MRPNNVVSLTPRVPADVSAAFAARTDSEFLASSRDAWVTVYARGVRYQFREEHAADEFARIANLLKQ